MKLNRRDFIKANAAAAAAAVVGTHLPAAEAYAKEQDGIRWDKAPCRFCGVGCSVLVGTKDGKVVAADAVNSPKEFMICKQLIGKPVDAGQLADPALDLKSLLG